MPNRYNVINQAKALPRYLKMVGEDISDKGYSGKMNRKMMATKDGRKMLSKKYPRLYQRYLKEGL